MKQALKNTILIVLVFAVLICLASCNKIDAEGLWENATYRKDVTLGEGSKEVKVDVEAGEQIITITLKTDADNLGQALYDEGIVADENFADIVVENINGITASWTADKAYWAFYKGDTYMSVGMADAEALDGEHYRFVYTK